MTRQLHLNAFLTGVGHHEAAWRLPDVDARADVDVDHYRNLAAVAERGKLDSLFFADQPGLWTDIGRRPSGALEPTVLLTALACATERIGLIATASTTYNEPFNLARRFASLDHISGGRAGWNIVTSATVDAARNFGLTEMPGHRERYERAAEFVEVSRKLWDSWEDDAVLADKDGGVWGDNDRVHPPAHVGRHFRVAGALNVERCPQGHPFLVQAGASEDGRDFAARYADAVFTVQQRLPDAKAFYDDIKARAARFGRDPGTVKILPGIVPTLGRTQAEADHRDRQLADLIVPRYAVGQLSHLLKVPAEELVLDRELPTSVGTEDQIEGGKSRFTLIVKMARSEHLTVRQLIGRLGGGRGHLSVAGTPERIADIMQAWFTHGAADGFNVMPPVLPGGLAEFVDEVVPILQHRGLFRTEYTGRTVRDHYGLTRPAHRGAVLADR